MICIGGRQMHRAATKGTVQRATKKCGRPAKQLRDSAVRFLQYVSNNWRDIYAKWTGQKSSLTYMPLPKGSLGGSTMLFSPQHQTVPSARGKISGSDTLPEHDQHLVRDASVELRGMHEGRHADLLS
ncbi:MAG: hypothetical protein FRX49_11466 [Trebouxia sp. A1-2]|nr:MAG: hypothetical protein FRX49_11466 [Trebouxia sp. A1-2]